MSTDPQGLHLGCPYDEEYFERGLQTGRSNYENYRWMPELTLRMAHHMIQHLGLREGDSVLDFGCAKGFIVRALRILGIDAYGCDVSSYAIDHSYPDVRPYLALIPPGETEMPFDKRFDLVLSKDVLEHMTVDKVDCFLKESRSITSRQFHVIPIGNCADRFVVPEYELDDTHVLRREKDWWFRKFTEHHWKVDRFEWSMPGIKENWTRRYPEGNGFFLLEKEPRFSLIMPTKNRREYILAAISAVRGQDFDDWELIIKDAGESVGELIPDDPRIHYTHMPDSSFVMQVESALSDAQGQILNFCSDDDVMAPKTLTRVDREIGDAMWLYGQIQRSDTGGRQGGQWSWETLKRLNIVPVPAAFWKREAMNVVGIPDVSKECYDWDYWLRLGARWKPAFVEEIFSFYRLHPGMGTMTRHDEVTRMEREIRNRAATWFYEATYGESWVGGRYPYP
jgi:SAM-dependent methyltransferase